MLLEPQIERLETPTVLRRRVPEAIAIEIGFVRPDPHLGHLNLSAVFVGISDSAEKRKFRQIVPRKYRNCNPECQLL